MPETQAQKRKELTPLPEFIQVSYLIINCHYSPTSIATEIVLSTFVQHRIKLWDKFKEEYKQGLAAKTPEKIGVTLPDGKEVEGQSWRTTPYEIAQGIRFVRLFLVML